MKVGARRAAGLFVFVLFLFINRAQAQSNTGVLRGTVTDPSGAAVAGAVVTATPSSGQPATGTTDTQGAYEIRGLAPGSYTVKVAAPNFQDFNQTAVAVSAQRTQSLDVPLLIQVETQQVQVSATAQTLDTSPDKNADTVTVKGKDLDALSDDPDQLQQDLQALAGPATGPNGGQMYVNGFSSGQIPPKSAIREIRLNQNPFSAEYDQVGFGRIEILTKPGTDKLHGSLFLWGNDQPFNSWSPFVDPKFRPGYYTLMEDATVGGSLNKRTSFLFDFFRRNISQLELGAVQDPQTFAVVPGALGVANPRVRSSLSQTIDYQVSTNNTLTVLYQYWTNNEKNDGISQFSLLSQGFNSTSNEHQLQATDTQVFHGNMVNETRFQYVRDYSQNKPLSTALAVSAAGYVNGGGNTTGLTTDTQNHNELQNYTTIVKGKHSMKFGTRVRYSNVVNSTLSNAGGSFFFANSVSYLAAETAIAQGQTVSPADYPVAFTLGTGTPIARTHLFDGGFFFQEDWQWRPNFTISAGMRFETQTGMPDHADYAPRVALAWGIGKTKAGAPISVLRAGWGMFYNRFSQGNLLNTVRFNGITQVAYSVQNPSFFPIVPAPSALAGFAAQPTISAISPSLRAPYTMQTAITLEQQITSGIKLTVNYINARGVHQFYTGNINTPLPGTFPQAPDYPLGYNAGYVNEYFSGGIFKQNQLVFNLDGRAGKYLSMWGYYVLNDAHGTTGGLLSDIYDLALDYGRVGFDIRNRLFTGGSITLKYGFQISPYIQYVSGQPFNITSGTNLFGTSAAPQNSRPSFTNLPADGVTVFATPWGNLYNGLPAPGQGVIPINLGTGPSQFSANLSLSKTFQFGPSPEASSSDTNATAPASTSTAKPAAKTPGRYSLQFSIYARNAFNNVNYGQPIGVIGSTFLHTTGIAGGGAANRQIYLSSRFAF